MSLFFRHTLGLSLMTTATLLAGACADLDASHWHAVQLVPAPRLAALRPGMTYAQFEALLGPGYLSRASGTRDKYWFLDDTRIIAVPAAVWQSPSNPVSYRIIGSTPEAPSAATLLAADPLLPRQPANR